jgi:sugar lactone lactonase YvrE
MSPTQAAWCTLLSIGFAACSGGSSHTGAASGATGASTGTAGSGGSGAAGNTGASGTSSTAGSSGSAVAGDSVGAAGSSGTAGFTGSAGSIGSSGSVGSSGGTGSSGDLGSTGSAGSTGSTGAAPEGGTTAYTPFACPPGPYPTQMDTMTTQACQGFAFNYGYNEGPTWIASQNAFFFSNFVQGDTSANKSAGDIVKVSYTPAANGNPLVATCEVWLHDVGCNGLGVASDGNIIGACHGPRAVMKYDVVTKQATTLATMAGGEMLDAPNDLISTRNGNIYFSNTTYELGGRPQGLGFALVRIDPTDQTSVIQKGQLNGMALSPDESLLYVVQMGVWNVNPDGSLGTKTNMPGPGGDGIAMDCAGNIVNENSKYGTNAAFGGPDGKTLIAVGGGTSVKIIQMTVPGFP